MLMGKVARCPVGHVMRANTFYKDTCQPVNGHFIRKRGRPRAEGTSQLLKKGARLFGTARFEAMLSDRSDGAGERYRREVDSKLGKANFECSNTGAGAWAFSLAIMVLAQGDSSVLTNFLSFIVHALPRAASRDRVVVACSCSFSCPCLTFTNQSYKTIGVRIKTITGPDTCLQREAGWRWMEVAAGAACGGWRPMRQRRAWEGATCMCVLM